MLLYSIVVLDMQVIKLICLYDPYCENLILQRRVSHHNSYTIGQTSIICVFICKVMKTELRKDLNTAIYIVQWDDNNP